MVTWLAKLQQTSNEKWTLILKSILKWLGINLLCLKTTITSKHFNHRHWEIYSICNIYFSAITHKMAQIPAMIYSWKWSFWASVSLEELWLDIQRQSIVFWQLDCCWYWRDMGRGKYSHFWPIMWTSRQRRVTDIWIQCPSHSAPHEPSTWAHHKFIYIFYGVDWAGMWPGSSGRLIWHHPLMNHTHL